MKQACAGAASIDGEVDAFVNGLSGVALLLWLPKHVARTWGGVGGVHAGAYR